MNRKQVLWICIIPCILVFYTPVMASSPELRFDSYTQEDGLPHNQVQCIFQDRKGWMWIGTSQGVSRFDGYNFVNYIPAPHDSTALRGNLVRVIRHDRHGNLLIGTESGGLNIYDYDRERFYHPLKGFSQFKYQEISVNAIAEDLRGNLFLGTDNSLLQLDTAGDIVSLDPVFTTEEDTFSGSYIRQLEFDHQGILWIGTNDGLYKYDPAENTAIRFPLPISDMQNQEIWEIFADTDGSLWIGTYAAGLFRISSDRVSVQAVDLGDVHERTETVRSVSKGPFGEYWIGTRGGLFTYTPGQGVTGYYKADARVPHSLSNNSILFVFHDNQGETWIGTRHGLNLLARSKQVFHHYGALPDDDHFLNSSTVYAFYIDENNNKIWIGTEDGGINILDRTTGKYKYLTTGSGGISQNCIKAFLDDTQGNLWVGTYLGGIDVIRMSTGEITHFRHTPGKVNTLSDNRVWDFCMDKNERIWIATSGGVDRYNPATGTFEHFPQLNGKDQVMWIETDRDDNLWIGSLDEVIVYNPETGAVQRHQEHTRSMYQDTHGRIWIATIDRGIAIYTAEQGARRYYTEQDGLANNQALCILEDDEKNLWISTTNGLSKFDVENESFRNFTSRDGLSDNQFCYGAACKTSDGQLLFGTVAGFNLFDPSEIVSGNHNMPMVFTDLKIFNKSVPVSNEKHSVLTKSISETKHLELDFNQNMFTVEFAALNFINSNRNLYSYTLEGFNSRWSEPGTSRSATYTNLNPGDYLLRVKHVTPGNPAVGNELQLQITILPPIWKTSWFITLLVILIMFLVYILVRFFINREKIKSQLVMERVNARKLHELDRMKLKFFTNISHEIRTPLTLIMGPVDKILKQDLTVAEIKENLKLVDRSARNLNRLINQLLDFRKLESGNLKLNPVDGDVVLFIKNIVDGFGELADEKQIKLKFNTVNKNLYASFDADKVEKIVNNLLSNALKFTDSGGQITINLSLVFGPEDFSEEEKERAFIELVVKDTGRGIPVKSHNKVFMRFFQAHDGDDTGTGIGLALVKELVDLHHGNVFMDSVPGKGTRFTIRLPYTPASHVRRNQPEDENPTEAPEPVIGTTDDPADRALQSKIMLLVEDNSDVRQFIASHFNGLYKIVEAADGATGLSKALEYIPDVIISDILMPGIDGYEMCRRIKSDERTSHIPVILLTALHSRENEYKGLTTGADDFITKPFDIGLLQAKVENMLSIRNSLKSKFSRSVVLEPKNVLISSPDERFLRKAIDVVEENISNSELDIESFSELVGVSRMQLYRKLHALTDMTVKEFIRHIRLKRAVQLLLQKKMTISEVAYAVGFSDLSHFRKCFKNEYGMSATAFIESNSKEQATT